MRFLFFICIYITSAMHARMLPARSELFQTDSSSAISQNAKSDGCPPFVDYAGRRYNTVQIGSQCWLRENLDVGTMISSGTDQTDNSVIEKYCFNDNEKRCGKYGAYYQWAEAMQYSRSIPDSSSGNKMHVRGICPEGWHIPTSGEFDELISYVGGEARRLKSAIADTSGTLSGFDARAIGYRDVGGSFWGFGTQTLFWSSSEYSDLKASNLYLKSRENAVQIFVNRKNYGFHIRCLKD